MDLEKWEKRIERLRLDYLFGEGDDDDEVFCSLLAEQHVLAALAALEQAQRQMALARLHEVRAIADAQLGR